MKKILCLCITILSSIYCHSGNNLDKDSNLESCILSSIKYLNHKSIDQLNAVELERINGLSDEEKEEEHAKCILQYKSLVQRLNQINDNSKKLLDDNINDESLLSCKQKLNTLNNKCMLLKNIFQEFESYKKFFLNYVDENAKIINYIIDDK